MSKFVMITGASGGLGRAVATSLTAQGWDLALVTRDLATLNAADIAPRTHKIEADMSTQRGASNAIDQCRQQTGDVAATISWLISEEAMWNTGQVISVDGGFTAVRPLQCAVS